MKFKKNTVFLYVTLLSFLIRSTDSKALLGLGVYGGAKLNYDINSKDFESNSSVSFGFLGGLRIFDIRLDLEYNFVGKAINPNKINVQAVFDNNISIHNLSLNFNYNFLKLPIINLFKLYVGGGIGETFFTKNLISSKINESLSWSVGGGVTFSPVLDLLNIDIGYKYIDFGKLNINGFKSKNITNNLLYIALRIGF